MDEKFYQSKKFKELKKKWYKKLKKSGFEDIEWHDTETGDGENSSYLKSNFIQIYNDEQLTNEQSLGNSYRFSAQRSIDHFKAHGKFENEVDKFIWDLYADGRSYRQISKDTRKEFKKKKKYSVFWVFHRIKHLRLEMVRFNNLSVNGLKYIDNAEKSDEDFGDDYEFRRLAD